MAAYQMDDEFFEYSRPARCRCGQIVPIISEEGVGPYDALCDSCSLKRAMTIEGAMIESWERAMLASGLPVEPEGEGP